MSVIDLDVMYRCRHIIEVSPDRFETWTLMPEIGPTSSPKASLKFEFKKSPVKQRKAKTDVRVVTLGQYKERERKGCYLHVDLDGTDFPIRKDDQFLETKGLKLTDKEKFYELCWNQGSGVHVAKTKSKRHFHLISLMRPH
jgi:hypothetical protein